MDFYTIATVESKKGNTIYPDLRYGPSSDLMIRGRDFYAVWDEANNCWSQHGNDMFTLIDNELRAKAAEIEQETGEKVKIQFASKFNSQVWHNIRKYFSNSFDDYHQLDEDLTFANTETCKTDYRSKRLPYALLPGDFSGYDELMDTLYDPEERDKLEWAIGAIVAGRAKYIQKFIVLYGEAGTGKSTVLDIIQKLFEGYYVTFDAKALGSSSRQFATEVFRSDPLVAIQHDGDLSKIESNETLNSVVSHEEMPMHVKYKSDYTARVNAFLFMGTNKPVKITDAKSGIIRRLIDVSPSGRKLPIRRYNEIMKRKIPFELGAIAWHCKEVFEELGEDYYNNYKPFNMMLQTDPFLNFIEYYMLEFEKDDYVTMARAWALYKEYCDDAALQFKLPRHIFRSELQNYFTDFRETWRDPEGRQLRSVFIGFKGERLKSRFKDEKPKARIRKGASKEISETAEEVSSDLFEALVLDQISGELDIELAECPAQYANDKETPSVKWENCKKQLKDLDPTKLHYVRPPENHIVIDFDLKDENGEKSKELNLAEASKWPATYAEFSKGGAGIHLHYIYDGDVEKLSALYALGIEVKTFRGKSSLRRKLTLCNALPIAHMNSGLPMKEMRKVVNFTRIASEKALRDLIERNLRKEIHPATKPSCDFIFRILEDAYNNKEFIYDVRDMRNRVLNFAMGSTHQRDYCVKLVSKMQFCSEEAGEVTEDKEELPIVFYDVEVFPNLFVVCWKQIDEEGEEPHECVQMINPDSQDMEKLMKMKLVGFNCRKYDNSVLYARYLGYNNEQLFHLSQRLIANDPNAKFREAYNISYADILEFSAVKQSLKKFEIELGIHHQENAYPWDQPVPEDKWDEIADYCCNDVRATEAVFKARYSDFVAQEIMAELTGMPVNSNGNSMAAKLIFGNNRHPNLVYVDLATGKASDPQWQNDSVINAFPGYEFVKGKDGKMHNMYRGTDVGFGGYVYAEPGMYQNVALLDVQSQHPHSMIAMNIFGEYTEVFKELVDSRLHIKHEEYDAASQLFGGRLAKYLKDPSKIGGLAYALKIYINKVYGCTSAKFDNPFRDIRNVNNIVALRGALFMRTLQDEVKARGFNIIHIKTDSCKIPNATPEIIDFCFNFAKKYGYTFEHEATYERMCLVNDAVYIARYLNADKCKKLYGYTPGKNRKYSGEWTATGAQFAQPFVYKTLFSKEPIEFRDLCETREVKSSLYLDFNEDLPDAIPLEKERDKLQKFIDNGNSEDEEDFNRNVAKLDDLYRQIEKCHNYHFIGKIGLFTPVISGNGGGILLAKRGEGYSAATGTKGHRWLESETVQKAHLEDQVDLSYYRSLVDDAIANISKFGDFEWFVSDDSMPDEHPVDESNSIPWFMPCKDPTKTVCEECEDRYQCQHYIEEQQAREEAESFVRR